MKKNIKISALCLLTFSLGVLFDKIPSMFSYDKYKIIESVPICELTANILRNIKKTGGGINNNYIVGDDTPYNRVLLEIFHPQCDVDESLILEYINQGGFMSLEMMKKIHGRAVKNGWQSLAEKTEIK